MQLWILYKSYDSDSEVADRINVNVGTIAVSLLFAVLHVVFEGIIIVLDSRASHISMSNYGIHCLGARMEWVPKQSVIVAPPRNIEDSEPSDVLSENEETTTLITNITKNASEATVIDFTNVNSVVLCLNYQINYQFTPQSLVQLTQILVKLEFASIYAIKDNTISAKNPLISNLLIYLFPELSSKYLKRIKIGSQCLSGINLHLMVELLKAGQNKVVFDLDEVNWEEICWNTDGDTNTYVLIRLWSDFVMLGIKPAIDILGDRLRFVS